MNSAEKLSELRNLMKSRNLTAYVIPSEDQHMSEYVPDCYQRRRWISDFSGSAGLAVVTLDKALMWVDSRYFIQAEKQLSDAWTLMKIGTKDTPKVKDWLADNLPKSSRVGIDGTLVSQASGKELNTKLSSKSIDLVCEEENLVDLIWKDRPAIPCTPVLYLTKEDAGLDVTEKVTKIRDFLKEKECNTIVLTKLDDVCWLLNLRGEDVAYNPYVYAYAVVNMDEIHLFVHNNRVTADHFEKEKVEIHPYEEFSPFMCGLKEKEGVKLCYESSSVSYKLACDVESLKPVSVMNPVSPLKAIKNEVEITHMRKAFLQDSVAMAYILTWLEDNIDAGLTEVQIAEKTTELRRTIGQSYGDSFEPIVGYASNAAIVHYAPEPETAATVGRDHCILMDTGGQYHWGTTDITRTVVIPSDAKLSKVSEDYRKCYTAVLKGHIALQSTQFPEGTRGIQLDVLARMALWNMDLDYGHGTGHGVGYYSGVHEGPESVSIRSNKYTDGLKVGMTMTDEPGYYDIDRGFGIRIENTLLVENTGKKNKAFDRDFLHFGQLSYVPIQASVCVSEMMSEMEKKWLKDYNQECVDRLRPLVKDERVMQWLERQAEEAKAL